MSAVLTLVHKPTVVKAVRWDDTAEARAALASIGFQFGLHGYLGDGPGPRTLTIRTPEGDRAARPGESTVIQGTRGQWYCIGHDVEADCYDPVLVEIGPITVTGTGGAS
jgi:hypothetical protein